ncbi:MAG: hypothetical protein BWK79_13280 [Beggiatoa sp. IS2]|nr:MAG: hypothetical protein BWK79_13280 [Beggiatoa sp. IS2]
MNAIDFLESAKQQLEIVLKEEVNYRNASSRAYYSAFHICKDLMDKHPEWHVAIGSEHQKLINNLLNVPRKELNILGRQLERIKTLRHRADYDLHKKFTYQDAKQTIFESQKIVDEVFGLDQPEN